LAAAQSPDPELSWRANEALELVCTTISLAEESAVRSALVKARRSSVPSEAAIATRLLRQWPVLRHHYAAAQLEALGAEIVDFPYQQLLQATPAVRPVPEAVIGAVFEAAEPVIIEEAEDKPAKKPLFAGLFKAVGRALGDVREIEADATEEVLQTFEQIVEEEDAVEEEGVEEEEEVALPAGDAGAVEVLGAANVGFMMVHLAPFGRGGFGFGGGFMPARVIDHAAPVGESVSTQEEQLRPGTLRIGSTWRGSDRDLICLSHLQQIHTVIVRDAPLTDAALAQLAKLPSLTYLVIDDTRFSSEALHRLRQQRPQINVSVNPQVVLGVAGSSAPQGLLVQKVTPETGARRAGLDEQDIITKVGGLKVSGINDVMLALYDKQPGAKVVVEYLRGGKRKTVEVELTSREVTDSAPAASTTGSAEAFSLPPILRGSLEIGPGGIIID
jgi:hypothetical protein